MLYIPLTQPDDYDMVGAKELLEDQDRSDFYNLGEWPSDDEMRDDEDHE